MDVALYASFEELRAICHTWGLYGVKELASRSEAVLAEALATLDTALRMHEPLLQRLKTEYLVHLLAGSCAFCVEGEYLPGVFSFHLENTRWLLPNQGSSAVLLTALQHTKHLIALLVPF